MLRPYRVRMTRLFLTTVALLLSCADAGAQATPIEKSDVPPGSTLAAMSSISGQVRFSDGHTVDGLWVSAHIMVDGNGWLVGYSLMQPDGSYVIDDLAPGSYRICAGDLQARALRQCFDHMNRSSFMEEPAFSPVIVGIEEHRTGVDFDLVAGGGISGRLLDAHGDRPLDSYGFRLNFFDATGRSFDSAELTTDTNGSYEVQGLPDGEFHVLLDSAGPFRDRAQVYPGLPCSDANCDPTQGQRLDIRNSEKLTGIDFSFHPDAIVKGRVVDAGDGNGIGGALVNGYYPWHTVFGTMFKIFWSTRSRADGSYELYLKGSDDDPVTYFVAAEQMAPHISTAHPAYPCTDMANCVYNGTPLAIHTGVTMENIDIAAPMGAGARGKLVDATTGRALAGSVTFYNQDGLSVWSGPTAADGTYRSGAWPAGVAYATATTYSPLHACGVYRDRPCPGAGHSILDVSPTPIVLQIGEIREDIDFLLDAESVFRGTFDP